MQVDESKSVKIERDIVAMLDDIRKQQGLSHEKWGNAAFAGKVVGRRKIQALLDTSHTGHPQKLCIADFVRLCAAIDTDPVRILVKSLDQNAFNRRKLRAKA